MWFDPAAFAPPTHRSPANLARIANLGEDQPKKEAKFAVLAKFAAPEDVAGLAGMPESATITSVWWRLHYIDRAPVEVACFPPAAHAEVLGCHPDATVAQRFEQAMPEPENDVPITGDLEHLIRRAGTFWEYSPEDYALVRDLARRDPKGLRLALESDRFISGMARVRRSPDDWQWAIGAEQRARDHGE